MSRDRRSEFDGPCAGCGGYTPCDCADQIPTPPSEPSDKAMILALQRELTAARETARRYYDMYEDAETRVGLANRKRRTCPFCKRTTPEKPDLSWHGKDE